MSNRMTTTKHGEGLSSNKNNHEKIILCLTFLHITRVMEILLRLAKTLVARTLLQRKNKEPCGHKRAAKAAQSEQGVPCSSLFITKTRQYNFDPLKPHFYIVKLGFTGV